MRRRVCPARGMTIRSLVMIFVAIVLALFVYSLVVGARRAYQLTTPGADVGPPYTPSSNVSDEFNDYELWADRKIRSRSQWTIGDAERISERLYPRYTEEEYDEMMKPGATAHDIEIYLSEVGALSHVSYRLRHNDPIEADARELLIRVLFARLEDPYWRIRKDTLHPLTYSRLPLDPAVRARVEAMFDDPDPRVADTARDALASFDRHEQLRTEGKLQERGIDYAVRKP